MRYLNWRNFLKNCFFISCRTRLFVQGSIQYNNYVDQEGIKRYNTSIVPSKSPIDPLKSLEYMGFCNSYAHEVKHEWNSVSSKVILIHTADVRIKILRTIPLCKFGLPVTLLLTQSNLSIIATLETEVSGHCWNMAIMRRGGDILWYQFLGNGWKWNRSTKQIAK